MSDNQKAIEYRRLVASFARQLSAEEVKEISYIRLKDVECISKYITNPAMGLDLLARLERLGTFSQQHLDGLLEIAKDVNRQDLEEKVKAYKRRRTKVVKYVKRKPQKVPSEKRKKIEETFEMIVVQFAVLEQHVSLLQRTMMDDTHVDGEQDEALEVLRVTGDLVNDMASKLTFVCKSLARHSTASSGSASSRPSSGEYSSLTASLRSGSSTSSSGDCNSLVDAGSFKDSKLDSLPECSNEGIVPAHPLTLPLQQSPPQPLSTRGRKPIPVPRKKTNHHAPIQETVEIPSGAHIQRVSPPRLFPVECEDDRRARAAVANSAKKPPPIPPRRHLSHSGRPLTNVGASGDIDDVTGESGIGTGSGSGQYGSVESWREAMNNPPPASADHPYETLKRETQNPEFEYQLLR